MLGSSTLNPQLSNYYTNNLPTSIRNARANTKTTSVMTEAEGVVQPDSNKEMYEYEKTNKEMHKVTEQITHSAVETALSQESNTPSTPSAVYTQEKGTVSIPTGCKRFTAVGIGGGGGGGGGGGNSYIHVNSVGAANAEGGSGGFGSYLYGYFSYYGMV
jgi:hypothetical protein